MKIETVLKPRRDGTVTVEPDAATRYVFKADEAGRLVCDVSDQGHLHFLLNTGNFIPADPEDFDAAVAVAGANSAPDATGSEEDHDEEEDFTEVLNGGAPIEANTPPAPQRRPGRPRRQGVE